MHALISGLDDVLDGIEEVADTFDPLQDRRRRPPRRSSSAPSSSASASRSTRRSPTCAASRASTSYRIEIHRLENEGDRIGRQAIAALFEAGDPIHIIKWRKVYNVLEETIDLCEDVADILERITLKNS